MAYLLSLLQIDIALLVGNGIFFGSASDLSIKSFNLATGV
jgi:hypothetical protein